MKIESLRMSANVKEVDDLVEVEEDNDNPVNSGYGRVMEYYNPKSLAYSSILVCIIVGLSMPLFGFMLCEITFVIIMGASSPTYIEDRNTVTIQFFLFCLIIGFFTFL